MASSHLRIRGSKRAFAYNSSFDSSAEADVFAHAWCSVIERLSPQQLRHRGPTLLELWYSAGGERDVDGDMQRGQATAPEQYPVDLCRIAHRYRGHKVPGLTPLDRRIGWLASVLDLDAIERTILLTLARCAVHEEWETLLSALPGAGSQPSARKIAILAKLNTTAVEARLAPGSRLWSTGLIEDDRDGEISPNLFLSRVARSSLPPSRLARQFMPTVMRSSLRWEDFEHIGLQREIACALVAKDAPVGILLYGPPGTGKTEFACLLAQRAGKRAIFAGRNTDGQEPSRRDRLASLSLSRALTKGDPTRIVVMDEADDILQLGLLEERGRRSKLFLNSLVEDSKRPTVWIVNEPRRFEESLIRRMAVAIEFPRPALTVRRKIVEHHARRAKLRLSENGAHRLASLPAAPAVIAAAVRGAKEAGGTETQAVAIGEGLVGAITGQAPTAVTLPVAYEPELAVADHDLAALACKLEADRERNWSLLLSGPSGTGKSAYARHLADRLQVELIERRGSDLLGMFVGETEANIAAAFHEAARCKGLLLIDEADDFLSDRRNAERRWERSMVNEMLRQMEALKAPFVATSNLAEDFDPATQRRFTIRATFRALDKKRATALFQRWFGMALPNSLSLHGVTPGDFALVARRAKLLGQADPAVLADWLEQESAARGEGKVVVGFSV